MADNNVLEELRKLNERFTLQEERLKELEREMQLPRMWRKAHQERSKKHMKVALVFLGLYFVLLGSISVFIGLREKSMVGIVVGILFITFPLVIKFFQDKQIRTFEQLKHNEQD